LVIAAQKRTLLSTNNPGFKLWAIMIGVETALWALLTPIAVGTLLRLRHNYPRARRAAPILLYLPLATLLVTAPLVVGAWPHGPLIRPYNPTLFGLGIVGFVVTVPGVAGMWSILFVLGGVDQELREHAQAPWSSVHAGILQDIQDLRLTLRRFLTCLGAQVAGVTLAAGAEHDALLTKGDTLDLPAVYVVLYGLLLTIAIALVYIPVRSALELRGNRLVACQFPVPENHQPEADWYSGRERLASLLEDRLPARQSVQTAVAILAPLVASLLAVLLPKS
jgi:hypothetical protein